MASNRIVVGIDFSEPSVEAARWAARNFAPGAEVVLLHVIAIPDAPPIVQNRYPRRDLLVGTVREGAEKRLREISLTLGAERVWVEIREGEPVPTLVAVADEFDAEVIVAGAHGERPGTLGSTAEHLVRVATRPVLLVAKPGADRPMHMLVPMDKSEHAVHALRWAAAASGKSHARVTALHVVTSSVASSALAAASVIAGAPPIDPSLGVLAQESPNPWLEALERAGVPTERAASEVAFGEPVREILAAIERLGVQLVVMGRRGEGRLRRAILGSVVDGVLRDAPCPVVIVPERAEADAP
jgi:nucleotide-binding universal stress UspA family protein